MKIFIFISAVLELEAHRKNHHEKNSQNFAVKNITGKLKHGRDHLVLAKYASNVGPQTGQSWSLGRN